MKFDINRNYNLDSSILLEKDIEPLFRGSDQYETFLNLPGPQVIFLKFTRLENLSIITNVNSTDLIITNPLYFNAMNFGNLKISSDKKDILEFTGPLIDNFIFNIKKNKFVNNVILRSKEMIDETSESEIDDILNNFINYVNYNLSILN